MGRGLRVPGPPPTSQAGWLALLLGLHLWPPPLLSTLSLAFCLLDHHCLLLLRPLQSGSHPQPVFWEMVPARNLQVPNCLEICQQPLRPVALLFPWATGYRPFGLPSSPCMLHFCPGVLSELPLPCALLAQSPLCTALALQLCAAFPGLPQQDFPQAGHLHASPP